MRSTLALIVVLLGSLLSWAADKQPKKAKEPPAKKEKKAPATKAKPDAGQEQEAAEDEVKPPDDGLPGIGSKAPAFLLKDVSGVYHRLSDHKGNVLLLVFFRTDCDPCRVVMQKVLAFYLAYRDEVDVVMIALLEPRNGRLLLDEYLESSRLPFPVLVDSDLEVAQDYIMRGDEATLPALFFIDEEGVITQRLHRLTMSLDSYLDE
jgi:peroxiredoxin